MGADGRRPRPSKPERRLLMQSRLGADESEQGEVAATVLENPLFKYSTVHVCMPACTCTVLCTLGSKLERSQLSVPFARSLLWFVLSFADTGILPCIKFHSTRHGESQFKKVRAQIGNRAKQQTIPRSSQRERVSQILQTHLHREPWMRLFSRAPGSTDRPHLTSSGCRCEEGC